MGFRIHMRSLCNSEPVFVIVGRSHSPFLFPFAFPHDDTPPLMPKLFGALVPLPEPLARLPAAMRLIYFVVHHSTIVEKKNQDSASSSSDFVFSAFCMCAI